MTASEIMTTNVITVTPDTSVETLAGILSEHRISGVPVMELDGTLVGIVTEKDLIRKNARLHIPTVIRIFDAFVALERPGKMLEEMKRMAAKNVGDICTRDVVTVQPDTAVQDIASIMSEKDVHLLPVLKDGSLAGIVGKVDVVRAMSSGEF